MKWVSSTPFTFTRTHSNPYVYIYIVRHRAAYRSVALVEKGDTRVGYNIISGSERSPLQYPEAIPKPAVMQQQQQQSQSQYPQQYASRRPW